MIKLKTITDSSWLIIDGEQNEMVGLLSHNPNNTYFMLFGDQKAQFDSHDEMMKFFNFNIFDYVIEDITEKDKKNYVSGYPVDLEEICQVNIKETDLPVFKKTEKSDVWHCAGYYCIKYNKGWLANYCPKYITLTRYDYEGPFKTEVEMKARLSVLKKKWKKQNEST